MNALKTFLAMTLLLPFASAKPKKEIPIIYLDESETLLITVVDNISMYGSDHGEDDRFYYIEQTLEEALSETDFPMDYKIERWGRRKPSDQPELRLYIQRWGQNGLGETEVLLLAILKERSVDRAPKNKLGSFRFRDGNAALFTTNRRIDHYNEVLRKALNEMLAELNNHFELKIDDPDLALPEKGEGSP